MKTKTMLAATVAAFTLLAVSASASLNEETVAMDPGKLSRVERPEEWWPKAFGKPIVNDGDTVAIIKGDNPYPFPRGWEPVATIREGNPHFDGAVASLKDFLQVKEAPAAVGTTEEVASSRPRYRTPKMIEAKVGGGPDEIIEIAEGSCTATATQSCTNTGGGQQCTTTIGGSCTITFAEAIICPPKAGPRWCPIPISPTFPDWQIA